MLPLLAGIGCASVPEMESRLQSLQFHPNMYVVQAGDTLETIAFRYQLATAELATLNPGIEARLEPGLRINVRPGTELPEAVRTRSGWRPAARTVAAAPPPEDDWPTFSPRPTPSPPVVVSPVTNRAPTPSPTALEDERLLGPSDAERYPLEEVVPREEIVADDLDASWGDGGDARATLEDELQRDVGRWVWPTEGAVARDFAPERVGGQGIDIAGVPGQDVRAALDGTVAYSGRDLSGGGNLVIVRHGDDLMTTYAHTDRLFVTEDDRVRAGDPIASLGWNAERESVLRFEVRRDGSPLDPMAFLPPASL